VEKFYIVVPWHKEEVRDEFLKSWYLSETPSWLILQQDEGWVSCAKTKNIGIQKALDLKAKVVIVLDSDCVPSIETPTLLSFAKKHIEALAPQKVKLYETVTNPPSRGTPYFCSSVELPVAASMGFWLKNGDYAAPDQLVRGATYPMTFKKKVMFWRFFAFSGMNCAFRSEFWPHFKFDEEADRYDDIFMGYRLESEAYKRNHCINLNGPTVTHSRQSNVWKNLKVESVNIERNETEWQKYI